MCADFYAEHAVLADGRGSLGALNTAVRRPEVLPAVRCPGGVRREASELIKVRRVVAGRCDMFTEVHYMPLNSFSAQINLCTKD